MHGDVYPLPPLRILCLKAIKDQEKRGDGEQKANCET